MVEKSIAGAEIIVLGDGPRNRAVYGNFPPLFWIGIISSPKIRGKKDHSHVFLSSIPPHSRCGCTYQPALLIAHGSWMRIGACNPMLCPNHVFRHGDKVAIELLPRGQWVARSAGLKFSTKTSTAAPTTQVVFNIGGAASVGS